jgi:hypothetical protein
VRGALEGPLGKAMSSEGLPGILLLSNNNMWHALYNLTASTHTAPLMVIAEENRCPRGDANQRTRIHASKCQDDTPTE